jgi:tetratricopeptide (TPR) repeat protein
MKILVEAYNLAGKYELAIDQIMVIMEINPDEKVVRDKLIEIYTKTEDYEKAIAVIEEDLAKNKQDLDTLKILAETCIQAGFDIRAIETINTLLTLVPDDSVAFAKLLNIHKKRQEDDKIMSLLEDRLDKVHDDIVALRYLAHTYHEQKKHKQTIAIIEEKILKIESDNAGTYYLLAQNYRSLNQRPQALQNYNKTLELDEDHLSASIAAGEICNMMGKLQEMIKHNKKALSINDDLANSHNDIAWAQATSRDPKIYDPASALIHARKAVKLAADPASDAHRYHPHYLDTLSIAQGANGQFDDAVKTAALAISLLKEANNNTAASEVQKHLDLFKANKTYRE